MPQKRADCTRSRTIIPATEEALNVVVLKWHVFKIRGENTLARNICTMNMSVSALVRLHNGHIVKINTDIGNYFENN